MGGRAATGGARQLRILAVVRAPTSKPLAPLPRDRIAFFMPSLFAGGAERVMVNIARGFTEQGFLVDVVLAKATGHYLASLPPAVRVIDLHARRVVGSVPGLVRYLRRERPSVLVASLSHANVVALWARALARVRTRAFITEHNIALWDLPSAPGEGSHLIPHLAAAFYPWADGVIAVSRGVARDIARRTKTAPDRIHVIYNPVVTTEVLEGARARLDHPWFAPGAPPVVLSAGRLTWEKSYDCLIRAFAIVRQRQHARLMILGEGPERPHLEALIRELHLDADVQLPGFVDNPYAFMARAAVFALSSTSEGLPTALIEALATGTPVVSTDCPNGPREILQDGRLGRLVPVGDAAALAGGVTAVLDEPRPPISPEAWQSFAVDTVVDQYRSALQVAPDA